MVRAQRIQLGVAESTWTVLGADWLPIRVIELFLEHLRQRDCSPNTIRSYTRALVLWWEFLELRDKAWTGVALEDFDAFLAWLRTGIPPGVEVIIPPPRRVSESTVAVRLQAVRSFYLFHRWRGHDVAPWLFADGSPRTGDYRPFFEHLRRREPAARATVRVPRRRRSAPTLTPVQVAAIKDRCATFDLTTRSWCGSVRDRFLFELLEETGLRLGEALSLQHRDWHSGQGQNPFLEVVPRLHPHGMRVKGGNYRKLYVSDDLDRLYAEYVWQLCDAGLDLAVEHLDCAYVLVNVAGGQRFAPMRPETVYKLVARLKHHLGEQVPAGWTPHWFRHTHATALLLSGAPVHVVSRRLGHADVQTTLNTYAWVTEDAELRALADWSTLTRGWRAGHEAL